MKRVLYIIVLLALIKAISCNISQQGSGNLITQTRNIKDYEAITVKGIDELIINQSEDYNFKITADDNVISHIKSKVINGRLIIEPDKKFSNTDIKIELGVINLSNVILSGRAEVIFKNTFYAHDFDIAINGSGSLEFEKLISDSKIFTVCNGSGNFTLKGNAKKLVVKTNGSGNVFAEDFRADTMKILINGSGSVFAHSEGILNVNVKGSGNVVYDGKPKEISKRISGSGNIKSKN